MDLMIRDHITQGNCASTVSISITTRLFIIINKISGSIRWMSVLPKVDQASLNKQLYVELIIDSCEKV